MPVIVDTLVSDLKLDLKNFRTVPQSNETAAIQAMISISPDNFWGLTISLLEDGYLPTENIIILRGGTKGSDLIVREGNRRVAALKLILGLIPAAPFDIPENIMDRIESITPQWKRDNKKIPCAIYESKESKTVERIVNLTHGKGVRASRERWEAVARARHNRDINGATESALDLLEKYLPKAGNISLEQSQRWAGDYPITVLDEAMKKAAKRFGAANASDLSSKYPAIKHRPKLDRVMKDIGIERLTFKKIRADADFLSEYEVPPAPVAETGQMPKPSDGASAKQGPAAPIKSKRAAAVATNDPRAVRRALRALTPIGISRQKIVTLKEEATCLDLDDNPIAFCFLLRSMFEISAKVYCDEHKKSGGPASKDKNGNEKSLKDLLNSIVDHLTQNNSNKEMLKCIHGARVELGKTDSFLSVTSMNQLVHNPSFTIGAKDIASIFGNVFPLLRVMNE